MMTHTVDFALPHGYVDEAGVVHRNGRIRMATALDEVFALQDARVQGNEAFLPIVLLARVVVELGTVPAITPTVIGRLFAADLLYLQDLYLRHNSFAPMYADSICPACSSQIRLQVAPLVQQGIEDG